MKQQGMALIVAMLITLIIGIIAVAIGKTALQNQQNAAGEFDTLASYSLAQSAMNSAEHTFRQTVLTNKDRIYSSHPQSISTGIDTDANWWHSTANWVGSKITALTGLAGTAPRYRIEQRDFIPISADLEEKNGRQLFRITTRGQGQGDAITTLQSHIGVLGQKQE